MSAPKRKKASKKKAGPGPLTTDSIKGAVLRLDAIDDELPSAVKILLAAYRDLAANSTDNRNEPTCSECGVVGRRKYVLRLRRRLRRVHRKQRSC